MTREFVAVSAVTSLVRHQVRADEQSHRVRPHGVEDSLPPLREHRRSLSQNTVVERDPHGSPPPGANTSGVYRRMGLPSPAQTTLTSPQSVAHTSSSAATAVW